MSAILLSIAAFFSTFVGGLLAVQNKNRLHLIMGFTAGVLLGVVSFDILPEVIRRINGNGFSITRVMVALVSGFLLFHILEKSISLHHSHEDEYAEHKHPNIGIASALALIGHSF